MSLISQVFDEIDLSSINDYKFYNIAGKVVYIENFLKITSFSKEEIILKLKKGMIKVVGSKMLIHELTSSSIIIKGIIKGVEVY